MGGIHEQQRKRRKMFVKINWENIDKNKNEQYALRRHTENIDVYDYAFQLTISISKLKPPACQKEKKKKKLY